MRTMERMFSMSFTGHERLYQEQQNNGWKRVVTAAVVILFLVGGGYWYFEHHVTPAETIQATERETPSQ